MGVPRAAQALPQRQALARRVRRGIGSEAYLKGTPQGPTPEDARKDGHIRDGSARRAPRSRCRYAQLVICRVAEVREV
jgi:hypothetical protein